MSEVLRFDIDLLPFIELRRVKEKERAARARKRTKVRNIKVRYPSVNTMYPINRHLGRKYLSPEGLLYKEYIDESLTDQGGVPPLWDSYDVSYIFYMTHDMLYTKRGELAEHDVSNFLKATEDALFEWLLESDKTTTSVHGYKRLTVNDPKLVILMSPSSETDDIYHREHIFDSYGLEVKREGNFPCKLR